MHQIQVTVPKGESDRVARLALEQGISSASVSQVYVHGPDKDKEQITITTATPLTDKFTDALLTADFFNPKEYEVTTQSLYSIVSEVEPAAITLPMKIAPTDVFQDLWQQSHVTASFVIRAAVSALLLSYAMIADDRITMIAALLFTPFLVQDLAIGFGLWSGTFSLARQGALAIGVSTLVTLVSGFVVASVMEGPMRFDQFASIEVNFLISLLVGIVSGVATADMAGRRELIGMAAAAQFAIYPAWFGISLVYGFPDDNTIMWRLLAFLVNVATIMVVSIGVYAALRYRPEALRRYADQTRESS